jgi:hypothetical protein
MLVSCSKLYFGQFLLWVGEFSSFCKRVFSMPKTTQGFHTHCGSFFWLSCLPSLFYCLLFTILRLFGTRKSIRRKVDHGGQIVLWYWQHATNLVRATVFVVCKRSARVLVWVRGKVEQKCSLTFCVFGQARSKCSSSSTFPKSQPQ